MSLAPRWCGARGARGEAWATRARLARRARHARRHAAGSAMPTAFRCAAGARLAGRGRWSAGAASRSSAASRWTSSPWTWAMRPSRRATRRCCSARGAQGAACPVEEAAEAAGTLAYELLVRVGAACRASLVERRRLTTAFADAAAASRGNAFGTPPSAPAPSLARGEADPMTPQTGRARCAGAALRFRQDRDSSTSRRGLAALGVELVASGGTARGAARGRPRGRGRGDADRQPRDARRPREDAPPADPRRHPGAPRPRGRPGGPRGPDRRDHRPGGGEPLPVRGDGRESRRDARRGDREDRHRRSVDDPLRREEPGLRRGGRRSRRLRRACSTSCASAAASRDATRARLALKAFERTARYDTAIHGWLAARDADGSRRPVPAAALGASSPRADDAPLRREPAPARGPLRRLPRDRGAAARQGALLQQHRRRAGRPGPDRRVPRAERAAVAILKHNTPCGVGLGDSPEASLSARLRHRSRLPLRRHHRLATGPSISPWPRRSTRSSPRC